MFDITPILKQPFTVMNSLNVQNSEIIEMDGKKYRCIRKPNNNNDFGQWEYFYNGQWHDVLNFQLRKELNKKL
jgi:hypothetical protein